MDDQSIEEIEKSEAGVEGFLDEIQESLRAKTYKPQPVRRVYIEKDNGKLRPLGQATCSGVCVDGCFAPLGIPTVRDRVIQPIRSVAGIPLATDGIRRSHYGNGFIKQYVRDHLNLRTEPATNDVTDYGVKKAVENLPQLREKMSSIVDRYHEVQQDILETFVDRGQLRKLAEPTVLSNGKRVPGLKLDHPRQLALMHALLRFAHIAAANTFTSQQIHPYTLEALAMPADKYSLASLRYDMSKLRAKGLVQKVVKSRRYRLTKEGYSICLIFLKLFERIYAPLTAGLLQPVSGDSKLQQQKRSQLDRLYQRVVDDLDQLLKAVGLKTAA